MPFFCVVKSLNSLGYSQLLRLGKEQNYCVNSVNFISQQALSKENKELKERLSKYEHPKNSNNSSIPPSKDENRPKRRSLREPSGLKPGGQKGRKGNTLRMVENPDFIEEHKPNYCKCCGESLENAVLIPVGKRQVYDIPKIEIKVTGHKIYKKQCSCGYVTQAEYPVEANAPVSYGNNIESLIGYFHTRQYLPFKRMQEMFKDVFNAPISEGGLHYILDKLVLKAKPAYEMIKQRIASSSKYAVGSDETGMKVNGDKYWAWTWQNEEATFITITDNRGQKTITDTFKNGFNNAVLYHYHTQNSPINVFFFAFSSSKILAHSYCYDCVFCLNKPKNNSISFWTTLYLKMVLVHDCWTSHFNTPAISHQICIAHLLRDLNYLNDLHNHKWSRALKLFFQSALRLKKQMDKSDYYYPNVRRQQLEKRLQYLINYKLPSDKKELITFQNRLKKYREYLLVFLYRAEVPPDNNASERAIRNIKIKQKVSTQFRTPHGAFRFAVLRSITDTVLKNKLDVLPSLKSIAKLATD